MKAYNLTILLIGFLSGLSGSLMGSAITMVCFDRLWARNLKIQRLRERAKPNHEA